MADDFISLDAAGNGQKLVAEFLAAQRDIRRGEDRIRAIKEILDHKVNATDFAGVAVLLGASGGSSVGEILYNVTAGTLAALDNADVQGFLNRIG